MISPYGVYVCDGCGTTTKTPQDWSHSAPPRVKQVQVFEAFSLPLWSEQKDFCPPCTKERTHDDPNPTG